MASFEVDKLEIHYKAVSKQIHNSSSTDKLLKSLAGPNSKRYKAGNRIGYRTQSESEKKWSKIAKMSGKAAAKEAYKEASRTGSAKQMRYAKYLYAKSKE